MVKVFFKGTGFSERYLEEIKADLHRRLCVTEVGEEVDCDVIVVLCPIVSRAGTDVEAALSSIPISKPTLLMVLHRTFDKDEILPNTQKYVEGRGRTLDLLFNEEEGLLSCSRNENSKEMAAVFLSEFETPNRGCRAICLNFIRSPKGKVVAVSVLISSAILIIVCVLAKSGTFQEP